MSARLQIDDRDVAMLLRHVGDGRLDDVRAMFAAVPQLVNTVGPHPYWGGRAQALHVAVETKRRDMFDLLLAAGADVNGNNAQYDHWSPLMLTFSRDQPDMRRILLERGAKVGLLEGLLLEDDALVEQLLRPGKSVLPALGPGRGSILAYARTPFAIDRLLELGASVDDKDRWGATPIDTMSRLGDQGRALVRHMAVRGFKITPADYARLGDMPALLALVDADPVVARSDAVVMGAVDFGHHHIVEWLLERGANANARSDAASHHTALHSAAWNGDLRMVEILLAAGADPAARDQEHSSTPCGWAEVSIRVSNNPKCRDVVEYLARLDRVPPA